MRALAAGLAYFAALVVVAGIAFVTVIVLAGPHAGLLPPALEATILGIGWFSVLVVPVLVSRSVWRRLGRRNKYLFQNAASRIRR
jgi:hypothetical protein